MLRSLWSLAVIVVFVATACGPRASSPRAPAALDAGPKRVAAPEAPRGPQYRFERGVVIAHWLGGLAPRYTGKSGIPHTYAAPWFDGEDVRWIADHGFDHLQIPVDAREWHTAAGDLQDAKLAPFEQILTLAHDAGIGVVLVYNADEATPIDRVAAGWRLVAARFAAVGEGLRFHTGKLDPASPEPGARVHAYVAAIRATSPHRFLYVATPIGEPLEGEPSLAGAAQRSVAYLRGLRLGTLDRHVGISFSYWEPRVFTFQNTEHQRVGVPFPGQVPDLRVGAVPAGSYGGASEYNTIAAAASGRELRVEDVANDLATVASWVAAEAPARELYLGRFGLVDGIAPDHARRYLQTVVAAARANHIAWSIYDYESGRAMRGEDGAPVAAYHGLGLSPRQP
jgi:hypothetical protein